MKRIKAKEIEKIKRVVEEEFPSDPALQQVHIARKIIAKEAEIGTASFLFNTTARNTSPARAG